MTQSGEWEIRRHRVALCGRVLNSAGRPAAGARVSTAEVQTKSRVKTGGAVLAGTGKAELAPRCAYVRPDGIYFFLDLADGDYTVVAEGCHIGERAVKQAKVARSKNGSAQIAVVDLQLPSGKAS